MSNIYWAPSPYCYTKIFEVGVIVILTVQMRPREANGVAQGLRTYT